MRPPQNNPSLPESTPLFNNSMRRSQNLPLPPRIYPPFQQRYATLPESTPPSQNIHPFLTNAHVRPSQNLPLPPRLYPTFQQLYATLPESTLPPRIYLPFQQLYARFSTFA